MEKKIVLQNVCVSFNKKVLFENLSFSIFENQDVCLIGLEGVGKSTLMKAILGQVNFKGDVLKEAPIRGVLSTSLRFSGTIFDYLDYTSLSLSDQKLVHQFLKLTNLQYSFSKLNTFFRLKAIILKELFYHPKFFLFDDVLSFLKNEEKKEIIDFLHQQDVTILGVTSNMEDLMLFPYLIVMGKEGVLMEGKTNLVLQEEKILRRLGFSLPFYVDLSLQLKSYGLVKSIITNERELTNRLWKSN